jgi:Holliday junction resolvase RusA-like endonuclease
MAFTPAHTRKYEAVLRLAAGEAMAGAPPFDEAIKVVVLAVVPVPRSLSKKRHAEAVRGDRLPVTRPDGDNYLKIALDGCNGIVFRDDSLATDLEVAKRYGERPSLTITVTPMLGVTHEGAD